LFPYTTLFRSVVSDCRPERPDCQGSPARVFVCGKGLDNGYTEAISYQRACRMRCKGLRRTSPLHTTAFKDFVDGVPNTAAMHERNKPFPAKVSRTDASFRSKRMIVWHDANRVHGAEQFRHDCRVIDLNAGNAQIYFLSNRQVGHIVRARNEKIDIHV